MTGDDFRDVRASAVRTATDWLTEPEFRTLQVTDPSGGFGRDDGVTLDSEMTLQEFRLRLALCDVETDWRLNEDPGLWGETFVNEYARYLPTAGAATLWFADAFKLGHVKERELLRIRLAGALGFADPGDESVETLLAAVFRLRSASADTIW